MSLILEMKLQGCQVAHRRSSRSRSHMGWHLRYGITQLDRKTSNVIVHLGHLGRRPRLVLLAYPPLFSKCRLVRLPLHCHFHLQYFIAMLQRKTNIHTNSCTWSSVMGTRGRMAGLLLVLLARTWARVGVLAVSRRPSPI